MVTILDCIERIPSILERIIDKQEDSFAALMEYLKDHIGRIDEIVFIGSGTSNTSAMTSQVFVEKVSGMRTKVVFPNDFVGAHHVYNPNALHVFTSQTGTSKVTREVQQKLLKQGYLCVSMTESSTTPLAQDAAAHVDLNCGMEEYPMRTIGYSASVFNHMIMGMKLGLASGKLTQEEYHTYLQSAKQVPDSHRGITAQAKVWFQQNKRQMMRSSCIVFTGAGSLYGVSLEAAVKFWEMPQVVTIGYELEEGLHGPNYGYDGNQCVIVLNDGGDESQKALSLARFMKDVFHNGLVIGAEVVDDTDLLLDLKGGDFGCLEFSAVFQIMSYFLAEDGGRDLSKRNDRSVMNSYFTTHQKVEG